MPFAIGASLVMVLCLALQACLLTGCNAPDALKSSQALQLAGFQQYVGEMDNYHAQVLSQMLRDKGEEVRIARDFSIKLATDPNGNIPAAVAIEKADKANALLEEFRGNLAGLNAQFQQRQELARRVIKLGERSLGVLTTYASVYDSAQSLFSTFTGRTDTPPKVADAVMGIKEYADKVKPDLPAESELAPMKIVPPAPTAATQPAP
jgi:hypothetical protein